MDPERAIRKADAAACVVEPRIVRRVLRRHRGVRTAGMQMPHGRCFWVDRASFESLTTARERGDIDDLPPYVILLARAETTRKSDPSGRLRELWRSVFHARIHMALEALRASGGLGPAEVRARVHRIGQTTFDEIRAVLRQDELLLPNADEVETFIEFAATFLELEHFEGEAIEETFPTLDRELAVKLLAADVDAAAILARCKPEGVRAPPPLSSLIAPPPKKVRVIRPSAPEHVAEARAAGNVVRAALHAEDPETDLAALCHRVRVAVGADGSYEAALATALEPLVRIARRAPVPAWSIEGRFLSDLQRACVDHERDAKTVDVLGAVSSFFTRAVVRPLPATKVVSVVRQLRRALAKIPRTRVPRAERVRIRELVEAAVDRGDERLRAALRPKLVAVLAEVGLAPQDVPEQVAAEKLVEELLDQISVRGFMGIGHLRDALSRNRLKCEDLGLRGLVSGDELLRADRLLADALDGVYRRGEIYLRGLQKISSLAFGTSVGRVLVTFFVLPLLAAFVVLEGLQHVVGPLATKLGHVHVHLLTTTSFLALSVFIFALLHSEGVRRFAVLLVKRLGAALHAIFIGAPVWLFTRPIVLALVKSAPVRALGRWLIKPAVVAAPAYWAARRFGATPHVAVLVALGALPLVSWSMNSAAFEIFEEIFVDGCARAVANLRRRVLPGLISALLDAFKMILEGVERIIYWVDERLVFRQGDSALSLVVKGAIGAVWGVITFLLRIYLNLLIEPQINPIKHFPVVTVSHKIILPMLPALLEALRTPLLPLGSLVANTIAGTTVFLLPGVFGFLAWEMKENYRLYRKTIPKHLEPVRIGDHGETMTGLLVPGFHSGTIPKVWLEMRRSARRIARREPFWALAVRTHTRSLTEVHHVEEAVAAFVEREMLSLLTKSPRWRHGPLRVSEVSIGSNRVSVAIRGEQGAPCRLAFDEQSGWILATVAELGFVSALTVDARRVFEDALAGLYRLASVDFVREEIALAVSGAAYDVCDDGLAVWPDREFRTELVYDLDADGVVEPEVRGVRPTEVRALDVRALRFRMEVEWDAWTRAWSEADPPPLVSRDLLPRA